MYPSDADRPTPSAASSPPTDPAPAAAVAPTAPPARAGVLERATTRIKRVTLFTLGVLVALFAVFNSQTVEVRWIFGDPIRTPLILAIGVTFAAGVTIGWIGAKLGARRPHAEGSRSA